MRRSLEKLFWQIDDKIILFLRFYSVAILRVTLGFTFLWFGVLKFFPGTGAAEPFAAMTVKRLSFGLIEPSAALLILAVWESLIGLGLILGRQLRLILLLLFIQMAGTMMPLFLFPDRMFISFPWIPTPEGQSIIKNLVLIGAGLVVGATVRGGQFSDSHIEG